MDELIEKAVACLLGSKHAIALTGAGISTESGIPDFRGPQGLWTRNPQAERAAYRNYHDFLEDPVAWWKARLAAPSLLGDLDQAKPNQGHYALAELESRGILRCVITQNVDALHEKAGSRRVLEYHGSVAKLRCVTCGSRVRRDDIDLMGLLRANKLPPRCNKCHGIMKTDGVSFGEPIPGDVARLALDEAGACDIMLVCGTSAVVYPFASLPRIARQRQTVTIIEINAEPTPLTQEMVSDFLIQGKTGEVLPALLSRLKKV